MAALFAMWRVRCAYGRGGREEALQLQLGELCVGVGRREVAHEPDDARARRGELGEAPAPHPRVELEMHRDVGRPRARREAQLEPGLAGGREIVRAGRAEQDDPRRGQGASQLEGLPERRDAERGRAGRERRPPHIDRTMAVAVGLDHGPELGALEPVAQHADVVADGAEVDRDQRAGHRDHCGDTLTPRSCGRPTRS